jgi:hypothetical protein
MINRRNERLHWSYYGLREQADNSTSFHAIFVAPQGIGNGWANSNNEDVVFTDDMIKLVEGDARRQDERRVRDAAAQRELTDEIFCEV